MVIDELCRPCGGPGLLLRAENGLHFGYCPQPVKSILGVILRMLYRDIYIYNWTLYIYISHVTVTGWGQYPSHNHRYK